MYSFRITPDLGDNYTVYCLSHGNAIPARRRVLQRSQIVNLQSLHKGLGFWIALPYEATHSMLLVCPWKSFLISTLHCLDVAVCFAVVR